MLYRTFQVSQAIQTNQRQQHSVLHETITSTSLLLLQFWMNYAT